MHSRRTAVRARPYAVLFALLVAIPVCGVSSRIFMSTNGNNAGDCANPLTPCLTFAGAIAQVNANGEVIAESTGGYGPLNITGAVTISGPPGVVIYSGSSVTINAPGAVVVLRGLTIDGAGASGDGIDVQSVGALSVESCVINRFSIYGIYMGSPGRLTVKNTTIRECSIGIRIANSSGVVTASIDDSHLDGNETGMSTGTTAPGGSRTHISHSTANNNTNYGLIAGSGTGGLDVVNLEFCSASLNGYSGVLGNSANASTTVLYSDCIFANNGHFGVERSAGVFESRGNNTVTGNLSGPVSGSTGFFSPR